MEHHQAGGENEQPPVSQKRLQALGGRALLLAACLEATRHLMIDIGRADQSEGDERADCHDRHQDEHRRKPIPIAEQSRESGGHDIAAMVPGLVAPELEGKAGLADETERQRGDGRADGRARNAGRDLGGGDHRHGRDEENEQRGEDGKHRADRHHRSLGAGRIRKRPERRRGEHAGNAAHRHDVADRRRAPSFADQEDAEKRAEAVANVGEKEVQRTERPHGSAGRGRSGPRLVHHGSRHWRNGP